MSSEPLVDLEVPSQLSKRQAPPSLTRQEFMANARAAAKRKRKHTELKRSGIFERKRAAAEAARDAAAAEAKDKIPLAPPPPWAEGMDREARVVRCNGAPEMDGEGNGDHDTTLFRERTPERTPTALTTPLPHTSPTPTTLRSRSPAPTLRTHTPHPPPPTLPLSLSCTHTHRPLSRSLALSLSRSLALSLSRPLALSPSRPLALALSLNPLQLPPAGLRLASVQSQDLAVQWWFPPATPGMSGAWIGLFRSDALVWGANGMLMRDSTPRHADEGLHASPC